MHSHLIRILIGTPILACIAVSSATAQLVADLDADGFNDLVLANRDGQPNVVLFGDARGDYGRTRRFGSGRDETRAVAVADIDGDGNLDIVAAGQENAAFVNDGPGRPFREVRFGRPDHVTYGIAVGDVNGDGLPDVIVANSDGPNVIYINADRQAR